MKIRGMSKDQTIFDKLLQGELSLLHEIQGSKFDLQLHNSNWTNHFSICVTSTQIFLPSSYTRLPYKQPLSQCFSSSVITALVTDNTVIKEPLTLLYI